jgi:iron complex transport system ATP-binding protein
MLSARHLTVTAGQRRLIDDVSIDVRPGEMLALIGPNGAGKTTLLRALSGDIDAACDAVSCNGRPLRHIPAAELATTARGARPAPAQRSRLHRAAGGRPRPLPASRRPAGCRRPRHRACRDGADRLRGDGRSAVQHIVRRRTGARASGARAGQIWRGTPGEHFLLLDEPVAALDIAWQHRVLACARDRAHSRMTGVLAIVHDLNLAARYADRLVLLADGRIRADGSPFEVLQSVALADAFGLDCRVWIDPQTSRPLLMAEPAA